MPQFVINFEKKNADEYLNMCNSYITSISLLRMGDTGSIMARDFHSISACIQQCFSDRKKNSLDNYNSKLRKVVCDLRSINSTTSYVLKTCLGWSL